MNVVNFISNLKYLSEKGPTRSSLSSKDTLYKTVMNDVVVSLYTSTIRMVLQEEQKLFKIHKNGVHLTKIG